MCVWTVVVSGGRARAYMKILTVVASTAIVSTSVWELLDLSALCWSCYRNGTGKRSTGRNH